MWDMLDTLLRYFLVKCLQLSLKNVTHSVRLIHEASESIPVMKFIFTFSKVQIFTSYMWQAVGSGGAADVASEEWLGLPRATHTWFQPVLMYPLQSTGWAPQPSWWHLNASMFKKGKKILDRQRQMEYDEWETAEGTAESESEGEEMLQVPGQAFLQPTESL